ncbi:Crp/Fnr family transcriptional regulator [Sphingomicrobium sediminis]|uniref:Crp/Fnr family transcriptional regulator n=1 Tax=Sphingomicrobium sediminis TaxID=2950949 RepID=A0A9X2J461_9SPHN|nr:Crp/Fnr family transcriptional regulator [Sphingomicrobium sediminis]MCM8558026.1 Crp/Fnr family transcriptional regulator [Sphingomicrobium sediminis]
MKLDCDNCPVRDSAACASLSDVERAELGRLGTHKSFARGETVFHAGDDNDICATLNSGLLKISSSDAEGKERILSLVHPAGFVGEMFAPVAHHDVVALADSRLCVFSRSEYEAAVDRFPSLARALLRRSSEELFEARNRIALDTQKGAAEKLANLLVGLAKAASNSPCHAAHEFELPMTRGEIAGLLGLTIETVSRQFGKMEKEGLITRTSTRGIRVTDAARLTALAG